MDRIPDRNREASRNAVRSGVGFPAKAGLSVYSDEYYTPAHIPAALGKFDLDPSAGPSAHAIENWRWPDKDGLAEPWFGRVWLNPPYSTQADWLEKLVAHGDGIALVAARPETAWFQWLVQRAAAVLMLKGRVRYATPTGVGTSPPCGSVLVAIGGHNAEALKQCSLPGLLMQLVARNN